MQRSNFGSERGEGTSSRPIGKYCISHELNRGKYNYWTCSNEQMIATFNVVVFPRMPYVQSSTGLSSWFDFKNTVLALLLGVKISNLVSARLWYSLPVAFGLSLGLYGASSSRVLRTAACWPSDSGTDPPKPPVYELCTFVSPGFTRCVSFLARLDHAVQSAQHP